MKIRCGSAEFTIKDGASLLSNTIKCEDMGHLSMIIGALMTPENLDVVEYVEDTGKVSGRYERMALVNDSITLTNKNKEMIVTFGLREKTDVENRLDALEKSDAIKDGAISEIGDVLSGMMGE